MAATERQILIDAPAENVFAYLADFSRHPEWAAHDLKIEKTSEGPVGVGSNFSSVGHQLGRDNDNKVSIVEFVANEKIIFESEGEGLRMRHHILTQPVDGGTLVTKGVEALQLPFPISLVFPLLRMLGQVGSGLKGDLQRIKAKLEEGAPAPEQPAPTPEEEAPESGESSPEAEEKTSADQE